MTLFSFVAPLNVNTMYVTPVQHWPFTSGDIIMPLDPTLCFAVSSNMHSVPGSDLGAKSFKAPLFEDRTAISCENKTN